MSTPSPPAAKRPKLDADLPASLSSPARDAPSFASAPPTGNGVQKANGDADESSDEEEEELQPEKEDLSHRDMYLDTVSAAPSPASQAATLTPGCPLQPRL